MKSQNKQNSMKLTKYQSLLIIIMRIFLKIQFVRKIFQLIITQITVKSQEKGLLLFKNR